MNKVSKIIIAILGGVDIAFSIFIPIAVGLLSISFLELTGFNSFILMGVAITSSIYRAINVAFLRG